MGRRITGRIKDIINRGGEKFSAREIENALCDHPPSRLPRCCVSEQRLGEQVVAYVTTRPGQCYPGLSAIIDYRSGAAWHRRNTSWPSACSRPYR
jgi:non-ribosomal peptide synthetase component E (peptide arylation enzyme)